MAFRHRKKNRHKVRCEPRRRYSSERERNCGCEEEEEQRPGEIHLIPRE